MVFGLSVSEVVVTGACLSLSIVGSVGSFFTASSSGGGVRGALLGGEVVTGAVVVTGVTSRVVLIGELTCAEESGGVAG